MSPLWFRGPELFFPLVVATAACTDALSPRPPAFQTDAAEYQLTAAELGYEVAIPVVFRNPYSIPVYFVNCRGDTYVRLEKLVEGTWVPAWSPIHNLCLSEPIVVPGWAEHHALVHIFDCSFIERCSPRFAFPDLDGVYRLAWGHVLISYDENRNPLGSPVPQERLVSNTFTLVAPP